MWFALLLVAIVSAGCGITGPSEDLTGHWVARWARFEQVGMTLTQRGDTITGTACATTPGRVLFDDVPVYGEFPDLQFTVSATYTQPCCQGLGSTYFKGRQDSSKDIVGQYGTFDLRFERTDQSICSE